MTSLFSDSNQPLGKKNRKRNIYRQQEGDYSNVDDRNDNDSDMAKPEPLNGSESTSSLLNSFLPKPFRHCLSGKEHDRRQNKMILPADATCTNTVTTPDDEITIPMSSESESLFLPSSCREHTNNEATKMSCESSSADDTLSDIDIDGAQNVSEAHTCTTISSDTSNLSDNSNLDIEYEYDDEASSDKEYSFLKFRLSYLFVTLVVMLADGLQGTHLYVLYEGYGFSVASLYCLGFITGAFTAPITGPLIDRFGRKKSALLYCALEVGINMLEQFPFLSGLIVSRVVGGITTNLLSTVFEAWLDTEYRNRGFAKNEYETLMRDSVVVSNLAAIASGYLAHILAESFGNVGPFEGAVTCTAVAFVVIFVLWTENYGKLGQEGDENKSNSSLSQLKETITFIRSDSRVLRVCITQGLTLGSLHIFIFLWSPLLKEFSAGCNEAVLGLDSQGEPAYGLIFGAFMAAGVLGGLCSSSARKIVTLLLSPLRKGSVPETVTVDDEDPVRAMDIEFQGALCYFFCAILLLAPSLMSASGEYTFSVALFSFIAYEFSVGIYSPCEGVMRSIYIPPESRGSIMTVPSIIVNVAVAIAVVSTECISRQTALSMISFMMMTCGGLQLSLVSKREWASLFGRIENAKRQSMRSIRSLSSFADLSHKEKED